MNFSGGPDILSADGRNGMLTGTVGVYKTYSNVNSIIKAGMAVAGRLAAGGIKRLRPPGAEVRCRAVIGESISSC